MSGVIVATVAKAGETSAEGEVRWYPLDELPEAQMWEDDQFWVPLVLRGVRFDATFTYDEANSHVVGFSIASRPPR